MFKPVHLSRKPEPVQVGRRRLGLFQCGQARGGFPGRHRRALRLPGRHGIPAIGAVSDAEAIDLGHVHQA